ncbi:hypothetical protein [Natrinema salaciae]|uniref:Uncharacterized protein n=1 Tax=Natrinema salaciae TaxID=1186196 RepID=A0A1H9H0H7_9EURY|nr:hypothetical protein [Natrinema salaciae]SEQ55821.1 hypothetical protein SAMN04489841_2052 [Natrinema salaciae]
MTTGPKLRLGKTLVPGLLAVALFAVMALVTVNAGFGDMTGFPDGISITAELGYALFGFDELQEVGGTEPFLAAVLLVAVALDAALDASLVLAKREEGGEPVAALATTGESSSAGEAAEPAVADGGSADESTDAGGETR